MRVAVIDLGTNTFNLLIADVNQTGFEVIHNAKEGVALGMGGIHLGYISEDAIERAFIAFTQFKRLCASYDVQQVVAIGTSAIRDASNSADFARKIKEYFELEIEIIDGLEEANLIYEGVQWSYSFNEPSLIMDIGGGSTEFIRAYNHEPMVFCSLDIGVSRAVQEFTLHDPLSEKDKGELINWFESKANSLNEFGHAEVLVGASGSFETFYEMIHETSFPNGIETIEIERNELLEILNWMENSTFEEREKHPYIIPIRRRMAPIAALKTRWIIEKFNIQRIVVSPCSLKEGVIRRFLK